MRKAIFGSAIILGLAGLCGPAFAGDTITPVLVAPGEQIGISCDALSVAQANSDVRVVLTISALPGDTDAPGYKKVLATDQKLGKSSVRVKVPNTPDIANHTYDLSVYVMDQKGAQSCDAGQVKVARRLSALPQTDANPKS